MGKQIKALKCLLSTTLTIIVRHRKDTDYNHKLKLKLN